MRQISDYLFMGSLILLIFTLFSKGFGNRGTIYYGETENGALAASKLQMQHKHDQREVFKQQDKVFSSGILKSILKSIFFWISISGILISIIITII
jgi:hypothetical protein